MVKKNVYAITIFFLLAINFSFLYAAEIADYIILGDIAPYQRLTRVKDIYTKQYKTIPGYTVTNNSGPLMGVHYIYDHKDVTYETTYQKIGLGVGVQVTQHAGGDSDKWLLHEVEDSYRSSSDSKGKLGLLSGAGIKIREINGNKFIYWGLGGGHYAWISNNVVVNIEYTDLQRTKPEPKEVIQTYLAKFPSTITMTDVEFKSKTHTEKWLKDEMERRLWLCDKWTTTVLPPVDPALGRKPKAIVDNMNVFLDYRQKYFNIPANAEKDLLDAYLSQNNLIEIQKKLTEYKTWWSANKGNAISLP